MFVKPFVHFCMFLFVMENEKGIYNPIRYLCRNLQAKYVTSNFSSDTLWLYTVRCSYPPQYFFIILLLVFFPHFIFAFFWANGARECVWVVRMDVAVYGHDALENVFFCHLSLNKCIYGHTHTTFTYIVYRSDQYHESIITNITNGIDLMVFEIYAARTSNDKIEHTSVVHMKRMDGHEKKFVSNDIRTPILTFSHSISFAITHVLCFSYFGCRCARLHDSRYHTCNIQHRNKRLQKMTSLQITYARIMSQFKQMDTRYDMDS